MTDTLSQTAIAALDPVKHELYALALSLAPRRAAAEGILQKAVHTAFEQTVKTPDVNMAAATRSALLTANAVPATMTAPPLAKGEIPPADYMPADTWARITAAIQIQAAGLAKSTPRALNPDSVLLNPDPLLSPRKSGNDDVLDGLGISSASRFVTAAIIALVIAASLTILLTTRRGKAPETRPASAPTSRVGS